MLNIQYSIYFNNIFNLYFYWKQKCTPLSMTLLCSDCPGRLDGGWAAAAAVTARLSCARLDAPRSMAITRLSARRHNSCCGKPAGAPFVAAKHSRNIGKYAESFLRVDAKFSVRRCSDTTVWTTGKNFLPGLLTGNSIDHPLVAPQDHQLRTGP